MRSYEGGRISGEQFLPARWDLAPRDRYMWASVQTVRGCPKHCSFCSVWRTDGQKPRQRASDVVIQEIVQLRRLGYRFIALADDNFYPVTLTDIRLAEKQGNTERVAELQGLRAERFELMEKLAKLPSDIIFFTQITMEAGEDPQFLEAMRRAHIKGALVGVESVTAEGLKSVFKEFNAAGDDLAKLLGGFKAHGVHVLGSFIFGLSSDRPDTFAATAALAKQADLTFAQFVMMTPFPGTVDFDRWEKSMDGNVPEVHGVPITRYWLIPAAVRPKMFTPHATMTSEEMRERTQGVWDSFYSLREDLAALEMRGQAAGPVGVPVYLQALSPDVREHGHFNRQRPNAEGDTSGALVGSAVPQTVFRQTDAGAASAGIAEASGVDFDYVLGS